MKNQSNDGIDCDYCGSSAKLDFIYYSFDFYLVKVSNRFSRQQDNIIMSADLCESCMELYRQRLLDVSTLHSVPLRCDVTGAEFTQPNFTYYKCKISRVAVDMSHQPYICSKCGKQQNPQDGPCCGVLHKNASVDVDGEYLEINFNPEMFEKFKQHIEYIQNIGENRWTNQK
jgi:DNA-directed RNA polymerase subunit RPC12/RpoP